MKKIKIYESNDGGKTYSVRESFIEDVKKNMIKETSSPIPQQEICISCDEQKETHKICMDCIGKMIKENQQEISDEVIEEAGKRLVDDEYEFNAFIIGAKWYREQLKLKQ